MTGRVRSLGIEGKIKVGRSGCFIRLKGRGTSFLIICGGSCEA